LTLQMCKDIVAAVRSAETRSDIGCTLITANGSVFCAGMDLNEDPPMDELLQVHEELFTLGAQAVKPIVVAVNGAALAGGLGLVAQGHVVLASPNAVFGLPEVRIGFWPFVVYRAVEAGLGKRRALELSLTGASFQAAQAMAWGLVHHIHPASEITTHRKGWHANLRNQVRWRLPPGCSMCARLKGNRQRKLVRLRDRSVHN